MVMTPSSLCSCFSCLSLKPRSGCHANAPRPEGFVQDTVSQHLSSSRLLWPSANFHAHLLLSFV
eukprot:113119-Amphidinium_carterae.1